MPKPLSASALLKQQSPRNTQGSGSAPGSNFNFNSGVNRLAVIQNDQSDNGNGRPRSNSVKRKNPEGPSFANVVAKNAHNVGPNNDGNCEIDVGTEIAKANSFVDKIAEEISLRELDPVLVGLFSYLCDAIRSVTAVQAKLSGSNENAAPRVDPAPNPAPNPVPRDPPVMVSLGAIPKKPRQDNEGFIPVVNSRQSRLPTVSAAHGNFSKPSGPLTTSQNHGNNTNRRTLSQSSSTLPRPRIESIANDGRGHNPDNNKNTDKKFKELVRDAERSTLIFNLDMGKVPVINKDTISKRATMALTNMAAKKEKSNTSIPSREAIEAIDDVLGAACDMTFFGNGTKTYRRPNDRNNGAFCTVPVCYVFADRDTRVRAEKILRSQCGVNCGTPYPPVIRECIRQVVNDVKKEFPDNFVRVTVDTNHMVFKVARKPPDDAADPTWGYRKVDIPIPVEVRELGSGWVPRGFKLEIPPCSPDKPDEMSQNMDTENTEQMSSESVSAVGAGSGSRSGPGTETQGPEISVG
jgi:hypothetical protein